MNGCARFLPCPPAHLLSVQPAWLSSDSSSFVNCRAFAPRECESPRRLQPSANGEWPSSATAMRLCTGTLLRPRTGALRDPVFRGRIGRLKNSGEAQRAGCAAASAFCVLPLSFWPVMERRTPIRRVPPAGVRADLEIGVPFRSRSSITRAPRFERGGCRWDSCRERHYHL